MSMIEAGAGMPKRLMRYTQSQPIDIAYNKQHQFAAASAISLYARDSVFTFIPKNGCSTLRYSAAVDNGAIDGPEGIDWIHRNNISFRPSYRELATAKYTFVVLRCPFRRLVSCFLGHIVDGSSSIRSIRANSIVSPAGKLTNLAYRTARLFFKNPVSRNQTRQNFCFADFVALLERPGALTVDVHWRPQVDFLVYRNYDDVFQIERMEHMAEVIYQKIGLRIDDARSLTGHGNDKRDRVRDSFFGRMTVEQLQKMKSDMKVPAYEAFYDDDLYQRVGRLYKADIEYYVEFFGKSALLQLPMKY